MKVLINITEEEFNALNSLIDLAEAAVMDAEEEHKEFKNVSRRNGGYSGDLRKANKFEK